jgi:hypothetical protein
MIQLSRLPVQRHSHFQAINRRKLIRNLLPSDAEREGDAERDLLPSDAESEDDAERDRAAVGR